MQLAYMSSVSERYAAEIAKRSSKGEKYSMMKFTVVMVCFLCATAAFGQSSAMGSALNAQTSVLEFQSHQEFATQHGMATEQNLLESSSGNTWAKGERPLWEVAPVSHPTPLGDSARMLRKEHDAAKKAEIVWNN